MAINKYFTVHHAQENISSSTEYPLKKKIEKYLLNDNLTNGVLFKKFKRYYSLKIFRVI